MLGALFRVPSPKVAIIYRGLPEILGTGADVRNLSAGRGVCQQHQQCHQRHHQNPNVHIQVHRLSHRHELLWVSDKHQS